MEGRGVRGLGCQRGLRGGWWRPVATAGFGHGECWELLVCEFVIAVASFSVVELCRRVVPKQAHLGQKRLVCVVKGLGTTICGLARQYNLAGLFAQFFFFFSLGEREFVRFLTSASTPFKSSFPSHTPPAGADYHLLPYHTHPTPCLFRPLAALLPHHFDIHTHCMSTESTEREKVMIAYNVVDAERMCAGNVCANEHVRRCA